MTYPNYSAIMLMTHVVILLILQSNTPVSIYYARCWLSTIDTEFVTRKGVDMLALRDF